MDRAKQQAFIEHVRGRGGDAAQVAVTVEQFFDGNDCEWSLGANRDEEISLGAVRDVLQAHPGVAWAAVRGRRAPLVGTMVTADVVLASPAGDDNRDTPPATEAELTAWCADRLPDYAVPRRLRFLDQIPIKETLKSDV